VSATKDRRLQHASRANLFGSAAQDVRYALRGMRRQPGFAAAIILTLGLAIAANASMFAIIDRLLLQPPQHVANPHDVVRLGFQQRSTQSGELLTSTATTFADYAELRANVTGFAELGVISGPTDASLGRGEDAELVRRAAVSASFFTALGPRPVLGRFFAESEDLPPRGELVAVISHGLWQRKYGGAHDVVGSTLLLDNESFTIIGVAPRGFLGVDPLPVDVWIPVSVAGAAYGDDWDQSRNIYWLRPVARLHADATVAATAANASAVHASFYEAEYAADPDRRVVLGPLIAARDPAFMQPAALRAMNISRWLLGVAGIVLLIAAANVANLLLARTMRRRRELGVRLSLGAGSARLAGQLFIEVLILAVIGAAVGMVLASWAGPLMRNVLLPGFEWHDSAFSVRMLLFSFTIVTFAALLAVAAPAFVATRVQAAGLLRAGSRGSTYRRSRLRSGLVTLQAALCVLLLVGAGLFVRSLGNAHAVQLGFDSERVITVSWNTQALDRPLPARAALHEQAAERVRQLPQIEDAAVVWGTQPFWVRMRTSFRVPGRDSIPMPGEGGPWRTVVSPEYFRTAGTAIVRGRGITDQDRQGSTPVAVVSERMAAIVWPDGDAIGSCFQAGGVDAPCIEVVGIAADARMFNVDGDAVVQYYVAMQQDPPANHALLVRTTGDAAAAIPTLRRELQAMDPTLPAPSVTPMTERLEPQLRPWRLGATLFTAFGALALVLATLGLYAVIAYDISQRRQELGVRLALGAPLAGLARMVMLDATRLAVVGVVIGLAGALLLAGRVQDLLFGVAARDPLVYAGVAAVLLLVALAAAALPARRATRVDPMEALNAE
jgi:putative ABC transport system permease protein